MRSTDKHIQSGTRSQAQYSMVYAGTQTEARAAAAAAAQARCTPSTRQGWARTLPELRDLVGERVLPDLRLALGPLLACTNAAVVAAVVCDGRESGPATRHRLHLVALQRKFANGCAKTRKGVMVKKDQKGTLERAKTGP